MLHLIKYRLITLDLNKRFYEKFFFYYWTILHLNIKMHLKSWVNFTVTEKYKNPRHSIIGLTFQMTSKYIYLSKHSSIIQILTMQEKSTQFNRSAHKYLNIQKNLHFLEWPLEWPCGCGQRIGDTGQGSDEISKISIDLQWVHPV